MTKTLVVDLDGSLIKNDLLQDSILVYFLKNPFNIIKIIKLILSGKAHIKRQLAEKVTIDPGLLPYNKNVIKIIKEKILEGQKVALATASDLKYANQISEYLGLFEYVYASDGTNNLKGKNKAKILTEKFGEGNFDYIGNSSDDFEVWSKADTCYCVGSKNCKTIKQFKKSTPNKEIKRIEEGNMRGNISKWLAQFRVHQWAKNILVFVPLLASHKFVDQEAIKYSIISFVIFNLTASATYIINDLFDIQHDRKHDKKKNRPIACSEISIFKALFVAFSFLLFSLYYSYLMMPLWFFIAVSSYLILTTSYSLILKKLEVFDVTILAVLYTLRIIAGSFAISEKLTFWILSFSMFIFFSLALVKRYSEIFQHKKQGKAKTLDGRSYFDSDLQIISSLGTAAGYIAVLILALYVQDPSTIALYSKPRIIWFSCPLFLFWISRIWILTHRGQVNADPVLFAIKDKVSWIVAFILGLIFYYATL